MTDLEKYEKLLSGFGLEYLKEDHELFTLIYLAEPNTFMLEWSNDGTYSSGKSFKDEYLETSERDSSLNKVNSYNGFYCYFSFCKDGKFSKVGIFEA